MKFKTTVILLFLASVSALSADDAFGLTAVTAHALLEENGDQILFLDVRDPVEIMFTGSTDHADANVPFLLADRHRWNPQRNTFLMEANPLFIEAVKDALDSKGLSPDARIITMCRSGSARGEPSAQFLRENGFPNAYFVIHGFEGDPLEEGPNKGMRLKNGWRNDGLPWTTKLDPAKIYRQSPAVERPPWLVIISSGSTETQAMALILATIERAQRTPVRILLCDEAAMLAVKSSTAGSDAVLPTKRSPRQLLQALIEQGARVEVCGIFNQTRAIPIEQLIDGVVPASPHSIAKTISSPASVTLSF